MGSVSGRPLDEVVQTCGYLVLETRVYNHPDDESICYFMHLHRKDLTNFRVISTPVQNITLMSVGFEQPKELLKVSPEMLAEHVHRIVMVARKPD